MESVCILLDVGRRRVFILVVCLMGALESSSILMRAEGFFREDDTIRRIDLDFGSCNGWRLETTPLPFFIVVILDFLVRVMRGSGDEGDIVASSASWGESSTAIMSDSCNSIGIGEAFR